jgi:hypothetical protein
MLCRVMIGACTTVMIVAGGCTPPSQKSYTVMRSYAANLGDISHSSPVFTPLVDPSAPERSLHFGGDLAEAKVKVSTPV